MIIFLRDKHQNQINIWRTFFKLLLFVHNLKPLIFCYFFHNLCFIFFWNYIFKLNLIVFLPRLFWKLIIIIKSAWIWLNNVVLYIFLLRTIQKRIIIIFLIWFFFVRIFDLFSALLLAVWLRSPKSLEIRDHTHPPLTQKFEILGNFLIDRTFILQFLANLFFLKFYKLSQIRSYHFIIENYDIQLEPF